MLYLLLHHILILILTAPKAITSPPNAPYISDAFLGRSLHTFSAVAGTVLFYAERGVSSEHRYHPPLFFAEAPNFLFAGARFFFIAISLASGWRLVSFRSLLFCFRLYLSTGRSQSQAIFIEFFGFLQILCTIFTKQIAAERLITFIYGKAAIVKKFTKMPRAGQKEVDKREKSAYNTGKGEDEEK